MIITITIQLTTLITTTRERSPPGRRAAAGAGGEAHAARRGAGHLKDNSANWKNTCYYNLIAIYNIKENHEQRRNVFFTDTGIPAILHSAKGGVVGGGCSGWG